MGLIIVVGLLLLILGCVAVRPRSPQVLYGTIGTLAALIAVVVILAIAGVVPWTWPTG